MELALFGVVCVAAISIIWSTLRFGISPMPTSGKVRALLVSDFFTPEQGGVIHELGAGWGTLAFAIARRCPRAKVVAHEGSLVPFLFCAVRRLVTGAKNVELRFGDFLTADLREASGVVTYLWTGGMAQLAPKFEAELAPGAFVISHTFAWRGREPQKSVTAADLHRTPIYRYVISR